MERVLNLAGKNSSEIFQLRYPFSLLTFCDYDLSYFAENAVAVCDEALRSGEIDGDRVTDLRNSLRNMHVYIEHNLRTVYDKIVLDCWIDYICRRDGVGTSALWNRFIDCKSAFEKSVFVRLCEYRYNKGINEWLNLVRVQDYAKNKVYFLFSKELSGAEEASARRNYFDLMFSVTARELGCRLEDLGVTQVFSAGRLPSAPFVYPTISKDIVKNLLADFDYSEDYSDIGSYESLSDQIAMDAFSYMKAGLRQELGSYNMSRPALENAPGKIYMPCGLKAAVDLEIDALIESGGWLARCKRCGRYYVKDTEYTEDYCSLPGKGGKTCLEAYRAEHPIVGVTPELERECRKIMDEMYARVTAGTLSLKEYDGWRLYLEAMKTKVNNGEIQPDDLAAFITYSRTMDISRSHPVVEVKKPEQETHERVVKPFVPERISRSDLGARAPQPERTAAPADGEPERRGFFTSPSVERQKSQQQGRVMSHVIRAERSNTEPQPYQMPFGENAAAERDYSARPAEPQQESGYQPEQPQGQTAEPVFTPFGAARETEQVPETTESLADFLSGYLSDNTPGDEPAHDSVPQREDAPQAKPEQPTAKPAPKIIRKNAAAISAYGKAAGAAVRSEASAFAAVSAPQSSGVPEEAAQSTAQSGEQADDPFWEIGSIFDVLEQSENDMSRDHRQTERRASAPAHDDTPGQPERTAPEKPAARRSHKPSESTRDTAAREVPAGIWTEDRHLFADLDEPDSQTHEELNMLKDKKRRTSKTQRLFDAIMKEPDDNPNFRKR